MNIYRYLCSMLIASAILFAPLCWSQESVEGYFYPEEHLQLSTRWLEPDIRRTRHDRARANIMLAESTITELRLKIPASYQNRAVKIFLALPLQTIGLHGFQGLQVDWESHGSYLNGSVVPGDRALLYEGNIGQSLLSGRIAFTLKIDARYVYDNLEFKPRYEIEGQ